MALEKRPTREVGKHFVPERSTKYPYRLGESFVSIAREFDMDPLELIWLNFQTGNPREVNWYLREYCGCRKTTRSGKNYVFSSEDSQHGRGWIYVPQTVIQMPTIVVEGAPPSGLWYGLGMKIDAGAGVSLTPLYAYLFSHDRYDDRCLIYMDGRSATVGAAFGGTPVIVIATGVYHPNELNNYLYEGDWDLQLKLGGNWGKIFKSLKQAPKMGPVVNSATRLARGKLAGVLRDMRGKGEWGKKAAQAIQHAAHLSPDEWADIRTAFNSVKGLLGVSTKQTSPKVEVLEIPFAPVPGVAAAVGKMLAEVKVYHMSLGSRAPREAEVATGTEWEE